ncbi:MAG TPA: DUF1015 domain-containing protein [Planctomycetota bacterium]|nr:DUF1015 domain-containing protein [Planctomycetota bacterium]
MAEIAPFKGLRYDIGKVGALGRVFAPPYDVIDGPMRDRLIAGSQYNIARISRSPEAESEPEAVRYSFAAKLMAEWRKAGVLREDPAPALYAYEQEFAVSGRTYQRLGIVAGLRLVDFGKGVHPHEETLSGPKADRRLLLEQTRTHMGQIFGLYPDDAGAVNAAIRKAVGTRRPDLEDRDADGIVHRMWAIADQKACAGLVRILADKDIFIADGHHRYEVALKYSREHPELPQARYVMATLVALSDPGLVVLPTHRLVHDLAGFSLDKLEKALSADFRLQSFPFKGEDRQARLQSCLARLAEEGRAGRAAFALYGGGARFTLVTLENPKAMKAAEPSHGDAWRALDVAVLHTLILDRILGIDKAKLAAKTNIDYLKDNGEAISEAVARIDAGRAQCVFVMNPTSVGQVAAVASTGEKMPQKSTFFHPKLYTGMVFMPLA